MDENYNLAEMSEEEKDELIQQLAASYNTIMSVAISLHNGVETLAAQLRNYDAFGTRGAGMRAIAARMNIMSMIARSAMGIDENRIREDMEFEDIVSRLGDD